jgi:hypothetical protein
MYIKTLLNESLLSVYHNKMINEGIKDHSDAATSCVTPQQLAKELNAELLRKNSKETSRVELGTKKVIYHRDHIEKYISKINGEYDVFKLQAQELTKKGEPVKTSGKVKDRKVDYNKLVGSFNKKTGFVPTAYAKFNYGYIESNNIPEDTAMFETAELNVDKFIELITTPPKQIFDHNPKMEKSDKGRNQRTVNTGLPAINGIIYDIESKIFRNINTCPGAGICQTVCYARKGFYGMNDGKIIKLIRRLNMLWNDHRAYYNMVLNELVAEANKIQSPKNIWDFDADNNDNSSGTDNKMSAEDIPTLVIRWNDAGDFFSDTYYQIAVRATEKLIKMGYKVKSYAYTKQAKYVNLANDNFIMNFSKGSKKSELEKVDLEKVKFSDIVPSELFKSIFVYKGSHIKVDKNEIPVFKPNGEKMLKQLMAKEYNIPLDRLKYQSELPNKEDEKFKYDVIVLPKGDSDIGAQRNDVHKTFLLVH